MGFCSTRTGKAKSVAQVRMKELRKLKGRRENKVGMNAICRATAGKK
jgi:hypothetical protein